MHLALLGKTLDDLKAEYMGTSESADAISNKQLDGVWVMAGTPNAAVTQIMTTTDAKILPIPAETVEALKENYPWYANYTIPAGTYAGQDEDVPTSAVKLTPVRHRRCGRGDRLPDDQDLLGELGYAHPDACRAEEGQP